MSTSHPNTPLIVPTEKENRTLQIQRVIGVYEKKYRTFASLDYPVDVDKAKVRIYKKINTIFITQINIDLDTLFQHDYNSFLLIVSALYGRKDPLNISSTGTGANEGTQTIELKSLLCATNALHTLLLMCYAARVMHQLLQKEDIVQLARVEQYQSMKDELEDIACGLINSISLDNENGFKLAEDALRLDYMYVRRKSEELSSYQKYLRNKFDKSKEVLAIAFKAKACKFLCQRPCLKFMNRTNKWRLFKRVVHFVFRLCYIVIFAFMLCTYPYYSSYSSIDMKPSCRISDSKFISHAKDVLRRSLHSTCIVNETREGKCGVIIEQLREFVAKDGWTNEDVFRGTNDCRNFLKCIAPSCTISYKNVSNVCEKLCEEELINSLNVFGVFAYLWVLHVLLAQMCTTISKAVDYVVFYWTRLGNKKNVGKQEECWVRKTLRLLFSFFADTSLTFYRFYLILFFLLLDLCRHVIVQHTKESPSEWLGFWSLILNLLELVYYILFSIVVVTSLRFFYFIPRLGFFVRLIKKMWKTVGTFIVIFASFWIVLAVVYFGITRRIDNLRSSTLHAIFSEGKFEVFGEVKEEDRKGELDNCHFNRSIAHFFEMNYNETSCLFRTTIVPYLVFFYMFFSGILLVNLLTAQLTKEIEEESKRGEYYAGYFRYRQRSKMDAKMFFPPPLSLLNFVWRWFWTILFSLIELILFVVPCCHLHYSSWVWRVTAFFDGHPWGVARDPLNTTDKALTGAVSEYLRRLKGNASSVPNQHVAPSINP